MATGVHTLNSFIGGPDEFHNVFSIILSKCMGWQQVFGLGGRFCQPPYINERPHLLGREIAQPFQANKLTEKKNGKKGVANLNLLQRALYIIMLATYLYYCAAEELAF